MSKKLALLLFAILPCIGLAAPTLNKLIEPDSVEVKGELLEVKFTLPCESDDTYAFVMNSDDTGDRKVAVGVVSSRHYRNCRAAAAPQQFTREVDPKTFGYEIDDVAEFVPMDVE